MDKKVIMIASLLALPISTAVADTKLGAGLGYADCSGSGQECSSQEFFRISVEQQITPQFSIDAVGDLKPFHSGERFNSYGVHLKYAFSPTANSAYFKVGPHYYERREYAAGSFRSQGRYGFGASAALGWQSSPETGVGYGAEVWYRTLDEFDAYGVSVFLSYGFNLF